MAINEKIFQSALAVAKKRKPRKVDGEIFLHVHQTISKDETENPNIYPIKGTDKGTDKGTSKGTKRAILPIKGTDKGTSKGTDKGTSKGTNLVNYNIDENYNKKFIKDLRAYSSLSGIPRKIVTLVFEICRKNNSLETPPLAFSHMVYTCSASKNSVKVARRRLINEKLLFTKKPNNLPKRGKSSALIYSLPSKIFAEINNHIEAAISSSLLHNQKITKGTSKGTSFTTSSSSNYNTTTKLYNEWTSINYEDLKNYGFIDKHIQQMAQIEDLSPDELQESINHFVFDLLENDKESEIKKDAVSFFMGILRTRGFYTAPKNFESLRDRKLRLKAEQATVLQEKREKNEEALFKIEFKKWRSRLADEEIEKLVPEEVKNDKVCRIPRQESFLKAYFNEKYWFEIQQQKYTDCF